MSSCADQDAYSIKKIRAHDINKLDVMHANPLHSAERFCSECHGQKLVGGVNGEPSCYQCHGKTWTDNVEDFSTTSAPANHTELNGRFYHDPGHSNALLVCGSCHGVTLEGDGADGAPPCLLCHENKWD